MIQCPHCGVESEENANYCSLCGEILFDKTPENRLFRKSGRIGREEKILTDYQRLSGIQKRKIFWKISGLVLISAIILTLLIDYLSNNSITWSRYPATISGVLFINFTLHTFLYKKWMLYAGLSFLSFALLFILFDVYSGETGWKTVPGTAILLVAYVTVFTLVHLIHKAKQKGLNVIAYSLAAAGIICVCIDGLISLYNSSNIIPEWSLIVFVSAALISILLLYIHYRLKKATDLKRFFHI
ncbi:MAG: zinc ribbon domain-containing protein [Bacteroidota bacterium]